MVPVTRRWTTRLESRTLTSLIRLRGTGPTLGSRSPSRRRAGGLMPTLPVRAAPAERRAPVHPPAADVGVAVADHQLAVALRRREVEVDRHVPVADGDAPRLAVEERHLAAAVPLAAQPAAQAEVCRAAHV